MIKFLNECLTHTGYSITLHAPFMSNTAPVILSIYLIGDTTRKLAELAVSDQAYTVNLELLDGGIDSSELFLFIYRCIRDLKEDNLLPRTVTFTLHLPATMGVLQPEEWAKTLKFTAIHSEGAFRTYRLAIKPTIVARCKHLIRKLR